MIDPPMVVGPQAGKRHFTSNPDAGQPSIEAGDSGDSVTIARYCKVLQGTHTSLILTGTGWLLWPSLLLTTLACLVLGMEVPTTAA